MRIIISFSLVLLLHSQLSCMELAHPPAIVLKTLEAAQTLASSETQSLDGYSFAPQVLAEYIHFELDNKQKPKQWEIDHFEGIRTKFFDQYNDLEKYIFKNLKCHADKLEKKSELKLAFMYLYNKKSELLIQKKDDLETIIAYEKWARNCGLPTFSCITIILGAALTVETIVLIIASAAVYSQYAAYC